ncbi:MAG: phosphatase PAP2 family protein [bacterium]
MFPNWAKNILFLLVYMLSGLTLVLIIEGLLSGTALTLFDTSIEQVVVHIRTPFLTNFFIFIAGVGSPFVLTVVSAFLAIMLAIRKDIYSALLMVVAMVVSLASLTVLKDIFQVSRPPNTLFNFSGWSFPSGHATMVTAFFFITTYTFFGRIRTTLGRVNLVLGSVLGTILVCLSRLYLGAHWALDVLAGITLGLLSVSFVILIFNIFLEERFSNRKKLSLW